VGSMQDASEGGREYASELTANHGGTRGLRRSRRAGPHKHCIHGRGGTVKEVELMRLVAGCWR
jgi:hypothetical protein